MNDIKRVRLEKDILSCRYISISLIIFRRESARHSYCAPLYGYLCHAGCSAV